MRASSRSERASVCQWQQRRYGRVALCKCTWRVRVCHGHECERSICNGDAMCHAREGDCHEAMHRASSRAVTPPPPCSIDRPGPRRVHSIQSWHLSFIPHTAYAHRWHDSSRSCPKQGVTEISDATSRDKRSGALQANTRPSQGRTDAPRPTRLSWPTVAVVCAKSERRSRAALVAVRSSGR